MILTVTLSPCIDKTATCNGFNPQEVNRIRPVAKEYGGKGINVARAVKLLGGEAYPMGIGYNHNKSIEAFLKSQNIDSWFIPVLGQLRTNLKIFDEATGKTVEINEEAGLVTDDTVAVMMSVFGDKVRGAEIAVLAGSLPTGCPKDIYKRLIYMARKYSPETRVVVDAVGEPLLLALDERPYMIKPNTEEFAKTFSIPAEDTEGIIARAKELIAEGKTDVVLLSDGERGAHIVTAEEAHFLPALKVAAKSAQGAGDAMVAGACVALTEGLSLRDVLRYGIAAATAAVTKQGTGFGSREEVEKYLEKISEN